MTDVFVSSMGIVSALGNSCKETRIALKKKRSGIGPVQFLQTSHKEFPVGEVKMSNRQMASILDVPTNEVNTRTSLMGMFAMKEALQDMQIKNKNLRIALVSGTTVGGMDKSEQFYLDFLANNHHNAYIATHDCGACTEMIANYFSDIYFYFINTISTACSSAANAIAFGAELIKSGRADLVVAGGCECLTKFHLNGFNSLMILDTNHCRPFDKNRAGLNLGEGAAYLVLESEESMKRHWAQPLCRLSGYANACDAFHQTASSPNGEGAYLAMKAALESAHLKPSDIDYINAHGTGTQNNDLSEGRAIERIFGKNGIPPVSSTKSYTGHTTSAAGAVEAVISVLALLHNFIPTTLFYSEPTDELPFTPAANEVPQKPLRNVLSNSFGFGGNDTCLIFSKV